jgi:hypothetical protein
MLDKVVYLPMPVSFEEKREWNAKGYAVVDETYKPEDEPEAEPEPEQPEVDLLPEPEAEDTADEPEAEKPKGKK